MSHLFHGSLTGILIDREGQRKSVFLAAFRQKSETHSYAFPWRGFIYLLSEYLYVSAGRIGLQVRLKPDDLFKLVACQYADIAEEARR